MIVQDSRIFYKSNLSEKKGGAFERKSPRVFQTITLSFFIAFKARKG